MNTISTACFGGNRRRRFLTASGWLAAGAMGMASSPAFAKAAASYPSKAIRIVVAASAGGTSDILARTIGERLQAKFGQPVVIDNRPGADSNLGAEVVARSPADGYTLLLLDVSTLTMEPSIYPKLGYNPRADFAPVTMIAFSPHALAVPATAPFGTVKELLAWSKAHPGQVNFGSSSNATRLAAARLTLATGIDMQVIPYKGGAQALAAVWGSESNFVMSSLLSVMPQLKGGRIKVIAVASEKRMAAAPDIPTAVEGGVADFVTGSYQGLLAPAGTPAEIVKKLNAAVVEILQSADVRPKLSTQGAEVIGDSPEAFGAFLRADTAKWSQVVKEAKIKFE